MKKLFITILFFSYAVIAYSQSPLVISRNNFNITPSIDSVFDVVNLNNIVNPEEGANKTWNYSNLKINNIKTQSINCKAPVEPFFSASTCCFPDNFEELGMKRGFYYDEYSTLRDSNYCFIGIGIKEQRGYIGDLTSNPTDSLVIPSQNILFDNPRIVMNFPTTYGTITKSVYTKSIDFQITVFVFAIDHAPCKKISHILQVDSIVGWGTLVVPNLKSPNGKSEPYNVLLVKRYYKTVDSLYLNGAPAPSALLTAFNLQQGAAQNSNSYLFWRKDSKIPLLSLNYGTSPFDTIKSLTFDLNTDVSTSVEYSDRGITDLCVYPNPAKNYAEIEYELRKSDKINIFVINDLGQKVTTLVNEENTTGRITKRISLEGLVTGAYYIIIQTGTDVRTEKLNIVR